MEGYPEDIGEELQKKQEKSKYREIWKSSMLRSINFVRD
jgi:hypothetical protein